MNAPSITTRIADLIRNPNSAMPNEWERSVQKKRADVASSGAAKQEAVKAEPAKTSVSAEKTEDIALSSGDTLSLSPLAMKILENASSNDSDWEKSRDERVQRIQQLVQNHQYVLSPEVVDNVAQKIVDLLP
jgi:anti-sigma28 factor (negative regulator of flagellin synthesis)